MGRPSRWKKIGTGVKRRGWRVRSGSGGSSLWEVRRKTSSRRATLFSRASLTSLQAPSRLASARALSFLRPPLPWIPASPLPPRRPALPAEPSRLDPSSSRLFAHQISPSSRRPSPSLLRCSTPSSAAAPLAPLPLVRPPARPLEPERRLPGKGASWVCWRERRGTWSGSGWARRDCSGAVLLPVEGEGGSSTERLPAHLVLTML